MLGELAREVAALRAELKEVQQNSGGEPGTMVTDDWFTNSKAYAGVHKFVSYPARLSFVAGSVKSLIQQKTEGSHIGNLMQDPA